METVLVTGYAKAPQMSVMYEKHKYAGVVLEINISRNIIVNADFTFVTTLANDYFKRLVIGYDLNEGLDKLISEIESRYFAPSTSSLIVALKAAIRRYEEQREKTLINN